MIHDRLLFGAAYYHEYQPTPRLEQDLDLMQQAGFSVIRVGESVWSTWEPEEGQFALDWLEPVLDGAHSRGIDVVLGTPTYAVPPWMARRYPEITGEDHTGRRIGWGARQEVDFTHPTFRFFAERVVRAVVGRYRDHPAVIGYQVDNEPGLHLLHNHGIFERFVDHLRATYGTVEALNEAWGLVYWSHRLATWADLWVPDGNVQPQYDLAWRRFQAALTTEMIAWQAQVVRGLARTDQFVTTCIAYDRPALEDVDLAAVLDVTSGNAYYTMQDGLAHPSDGSSRQGWTATGTWALFQAADTMWSSRGAPFLVTETDAQSIGGPSTNFPAYPGQWRQAAWALVARGARMIEYWHWHTLHFGAETYWGGVLPHSQRPGRAYRELAGLGGELRRAGALVAAATPDADVAVLYASDSRWALQGQPSLSLADGAPDPNTYPRIVSAFYRGAFDAGLQVRVVRPQLLFAEDPARVAQIRPVLVVAAYYPAHDDALDWLERYAAAGGHLVLGPRTGYADPEARARTDVQPARLHEAAGTWYDEFSNLTDDVTVAPVPGAGLHLAGARATAWVDGLVADGSDVLVRYVHPHFGAWPAVTTRAHGMGRVTVVGTVPNPAFAASLARWLVPAPLSGWADLPPSVTVHTSTRTDGDRVHIMHNWSWEAVEVTAPSDMSDALADGSDAREIAAGDRLALGAWDVRVLVTR